MTFTVESKSQLAKLLATENISIEHQKISTAKFDPKNRVLYCPIWENMSGDLYDLLMGHEVGHALYTPPEGWHDAISGRGRNFKGFLNVVEDARIEKKIKRRYPGLNTSFIRGYENLLERDFFGIKNRDVNALSFIDRLNIYFKTSNLTNIDFSEEELKMVRQVENCETWEDVLRITEVVFDYSKDEQFETQQAMQSMSGQSNDEFDDYDYDESDEEGDNDADGESDFGETRDIDSDEENEDADSGEMKAESGEEGEEQEEQKRGKELNRFKESSLDNSKEDFQPNCSTDETFRKLETQLVSSECKPYIYTTIPEPILENIITPASRVHQLLEECYFTASPEAITRANEQLRQFRSKNERYVGLLAKEFEMKKAARAFAKAKTSSTGDIDINKLYKYQSDDNIFRKMMRVPKGKSHGLVLLLDRSGSMSDNMAGSLEQIMVLALFCRKVNIPFVVYGFGNSSQGRNADFPEERGMPTKKCFTKKLGDISLEYVYLREYINSNMGNAEFNRCLRNIVRLKESYESRWSRRPDSEHLSNTPLNEALVALVPITEKFRKVNNLDLVNLVIVHDGDADSTNARWVEFETGDGNTRLVPNRFYAANENVFVREKNKQIQFDPKIDHYESVRKVFFDYFRAKTGAKIFGFFIAGKGRQLRFALTNRYYDKNGEDVMTVTNRQLSGNPYTMYRYKYEKSPLVDSLVSRIKDEKFVESKNPGYDGFYIIPGGDDLTIHDEGLVVNGNVTASKLKTAFLKMNKKKQVNRIMVSRFIEGIAA